MKNEFANMLIKDNNHIKNIFCYKDMQEIKEFNIPAKVYYYFNKQNLVNNSGRSWYNLSFTDCFWLLILNTMQEVTKQQKIKKKAKDYLFSSDQASEIEHERELNHLKETLKKSKLSFYYKQKVLNSIKLSGSDCKNSILSDCIGEIITDSNSNKILAINNSEVLILDANGTAKLQDNCYIMISLNRLIEPLLQNENLKNIFSQKISKWKLN